MQSGLLLLRHGREFFQTHQWQFRLRVSPETTLKLPSAASLRSCPFDSQSREGVLGCFSYPRPPFSFQRVLFVSDPCTLDINGVVFGLTSVDLLFHMGAEEISRCVQKRSTAPKRSVAGRGGRVGGRVGTSRLLPLRFPVGGVRALIHAPLAQRAQLPLLQIFGEL